MLITKIEFTKKSFSDLPPEMRCKNTPYKMGKTIHGIFFVPMKCLDFLLNCINVSKVFDAIKIILILSINECWLWKSHLPSFLFPLCRRKCVSKRHPTKAGKSFNGKSLFQRKASIYSFKHKFSYAYTKSFDIDLYRCIFLIEFIK